LHRDALITTSHLAWHRTGRLAGLVLDLAVRLVFFTSQAFGFFTSQAFGLAVCLGFFTSQAFGFFTSQAFDLAVCLGFFTSQAFGFFTSQAFDLTGCEFTRRARDCLWQVSARSIPEPDHLAAHRTLSSSVAWHPCRLHLLDDGGRFDSARQHTHYVDPLHTGQNIVI
jgi:hypothetical protein